MSVKSDLDRAFRKKVLGLTEQVVRKTALDIDRELVSQTPRDTGRASANWLPSIGTPRTDTVEAGQKPDIEPVLSDYKIGQTIFISNNLPYIQRLNDGYSSQQSTPSWVQATVAKYNRKLKQVTKELSRGL